MRAAAAAALLLCGVAACHAAGWAYDDSLDEVSGTSIHQATLASANSLDLPAPYAGRNPGTLAVRGTVGAGQEVVVSIAKGKLACHAPCKVAVRFDEQAPVVFTGTEVADSATSTVLLQPGQRFIDGAKKARKIRIELPVEKAGTQALVFEAGGVLQWAAAVPAKKAAGK
jgi:hypothetical protein